MFSFIVPREVTSRVLSTTVVLIALVVAAVAILHAIGMPDSVKVIILGTEVGVSTWTLAMIALFWADGTLYLRGHYPRVKNRSLYAVGVLLAVTVVVSVAFHEAGHALMFRLFGYNIVEAGISWWGAYVAAEQGLSSLSPLGQICVSLAGPATNVLLALIALLPVWIMGESLAENSYQYFAVVNLRLAKYNMLPFVAVLDGSKALQGLLRALGMNGDSAFWTSLIVGMIMYLVYKFLTEGTASLESRLAEL